MSAPNQEAWARAISDFIKNETMFSDIDLSDRYTLIQISNGLKLVNEWILRLNEKNNELPEAR